MRPKVALALGSGGARGFAHIGVIKVLRDEGIPIDMIAGSSIGALVGSIYCSNLDIERMYQLSKYFNQKYYMDVVVPKMGFVAGKRIKEFMKMITYGKNIEELKVPLAIVATDILAGEKVVFTEGDIASAVRASISVPGIFVPEKIDGKLLVDGGVIDRIPISVAKEMGADIVIGVDVSAIQKNQPIQSIYDVIMQSIDILQYEAVKNRELASDIMLRPDVAQFDSKSFTNLEEIIKVGEEEARKHIDEIKLLVGM